MDKIFGDQKDGGGTGVMGDLIQRSRNRRVGGDGGGFNIGGDDSGFGLGGPSRANDPIGQTLGAGQLLPVPLPVVFSEGLPDFKDINGEITPMFRQISNEWVIQSQP